MTGAWQLLEDAAGRTGWETRRVGDLVELTNGFPFDSKGFGPQGTLPLVRIRDLFLQEFATYVSGPIPGHVVLRDGDIVIGMDGDFELTVWQRGPAALNQRMCLLRPRAGVDPRFVAYAIPRHLRVLNDLTYATTVKHLSSFDILSERILCPSNDRQKAIADLLDAETARIDALTSRCNELVERLTEQRAAITVAGVSGEPLRRPSRSSSLKWLPKVPSHWAEVRLSLVAQLGSGHTPSREHPEWWIDCTIPWITTGEVWQIRDDRIEYLTETREMISHLGIANSSAELHPAGTVALSRTASAGYSAIMAKDMATSQDYVTWTCGPRLRPRFLLLCLRAMRPDLLGRLAMGSTHQTIYVPDIQSIRIPLPPLDEQDRLVEWTWQRLHRIDAVTDAIRRQVELLAERRRALITAAVTGKLAIPGVAA